MNWIKRYNEFGGLKMTIGRGCLTGKQNLNFYDLNLKKKIEFLWFGFLKGLNF